MSQPQLTILLVTSRRVARADFNAPGSGPRTLAAGPRLPGGTPAEGVGAALGLGGRVGRQVWVLCEDAWMQSVELARGQVAGLTGEQMARALSFEVEPFSGIAVTEAALGFRESGEKGAARSFWIVEMPAAARAEIHQAVAAAGGKLAGLCHPGGLPHAIHAGSAGERWQRLEVWNGAMLWLEASGGAAQVRLVNAPPAGLEGAGTRLEWLGEGPEAAPRNVDPTLPWARYFLDEEAHLRAWLGAWAMEVRKAAPGVPVLPPPAPKPSARKYLLAGVGLEAAALAICLGHGWWQTRERDARRQEQAELARVNREVQAATKENAALRKKIEEFEARGEERQRMAARRTAMPALLRALAATRPEDVVLNGIQPAGASNLVVSGLALEALSVDEMSMVLTDALRNSGWRAEPLAKAAKGQLPNAGPWEFSISLSQNEPAPPAKTKPKRTR